mmetsp:Transcript_93633/g.267934  ORF Transcript_93633/g.267934 Transcript_93633/m.267934 type:complete len:200 (+) Transcript_93633:628-1227(+)
MFAIGFQVSAATRVGHELGSGNPIAARRAAFTAAALAAIESCALAVVLLSLQRVVPSWFTGRVDKTARSLAGDVTHTFFLLAVYVCGDAISTAFGGAITGAGRQCHSAAVVLVCYFVVALPLAYVVGVRWHFGFMGIISMMVIGTWAQAGGNALIVLRTDFQKESVAATDRVQWRVVSSKDGDGDDCRSGELELGPVEL